MIIYCFKCKLKTETLDGIEKTSSNGRNMITGICSVCGTKKSVFLYHRRIVNLFKGKASV